MEVKFEKAKTEFIDGIAECIKLLMEEHASLDKFYKINIDHSSLVELISKEISDDSRFIFCAIDDNKVIGFIRGFLRLHPKDRSESFSVLDDMYIRPSYRKTGISQKLFDAFCVWTKENNIKRIELTVDIRNEVGFKFWKKLGFTEYQSKMFKVV